MIVYIEEGDIFSFSTIKNYAHGCNCAGAMGKGIALAFKEKFPDMYAEYKKRCQMKLFLPGDVYDYQKGEYHVFNLATQVTWHSGAKLQYVKESLQKMLQYAKASGIKNIALPAIGTGLGGLDWNDVKKVIEEFGSIIPEVSIDEYELMFDTSFIGFTLQLLDENCEEVYCTIITSSTVILPSTLSGEYEILLLPDTGSIYFFGTITL